MGNGIATNSATATGTLLSSLSVTGNMDVTGTFTVSDNILMTGTGAIDIASGTTAQRPGSPSAGMFVSIVKQQNLKDMMEVLGGRLEEQQLQEQQIY